MPNYLTNRFLNVKDATIKNKRYFDVTCFENVLERCQRKANCSVLKLMSFYLSRIYVVSPAYFWSTLKYCSPWPNNKKIKIVEENKKEGFKVYSSLGVVYKNDPKVHIIVQES